MKGERAPRVGLAGGVSRLVFVLGSALSLQGCGTQSEKCPCWRRLSEDDAAERPEDDAERPGRQLSSRRRRSFTSSPREYSEFCCEALILSTTAWPTWNLYAYGYGYGEETTTEAYGYGEETTTEAYDYGEETTTEAYGEETTTEAYGSQQTTTEGPLTSWVGGPWQYPSNYSIFPNADWSRVRFVEESYQPESCSWTWRKDNAFFAVDICIPLVRFGTSHMYAYIDDSLMYAEWDSLDCSGEVKETRSWSSHCQYATSNANYKSIGPSLSLIHQLPERTGHLEYSLNMTGAAWAYGIYPDSSCTGEPTEIWVSPLNACKREAYGSYKMMCENGKVVQHYHEAIQHEDGCADFDAQCLCKAQIPLPDDTKGFDQLSTSACTAFNVGAFYLEEIRYFKVLAGCS
ncbi:unnamed protein product [Durusdinium trenchii]|uniref:Uncharacterized protein n=1 Tax=Durusdinium trenchii TaxID=1381693 RepID=A0ABP0LSY9_9DINO